VTITILKGDLKRQDSFVDPKAVDFSFGRNTIIVDDRTCFSARSRVVLKTALLVGFLAAALKDPQFRHPRFLMIDITGDKGMGQARSHNFQKHVIEISAASGVEHQVILGTERDSRAAIRRTVFNPRKRNIELPLNAGTQ